MSKHTPGPWHHAMISDKTWNVGVYDSSGTSVAIIKVASALHGPRRDADARLIAAAPELLEALRALEDLGGLGVTAHRLIRVALAKAEGT